MEPHIAAFEVPFVPGMAARREASLFLHTSPEYAMKRLLAEGFDRIFQIARVFRNGEVATLHNPEFTMLEFYRARCDYRQIMEDLEAVTGAVADAIGGSKPPSTPFERRTYREALLSRTGIDFSECEDAGALRLAATRQGISLTGSTNNRDDLLTEIFLDHVEPTLGRGTPTFLIDYPASMAALARLKPGDPSVAERFELYIEGIELANGFSELNDSEEQRRRLINEQSQRREAGRPAYPLDEKFIEAVGRMPPSAGVAVGLDRVLMRLLGAEQVRDVLLFPADDFL
jgi:lysyl-tRNA synthetase class 2